MQETLGFNKNDASTKVEKSKRKMMEIHKITQANRVQVHYEQTTYVLGEDVPNHKNYKTKVPVVIFNATDGIMTVYQIKPAGQTTTRDIVIALGNGEFNGKLKDVL
ncbi:hypothetical protein LF887_15450 [Chryseobacterium sp. MEBOG06]|uniref:hypothetical protein n=1 Tax=Chryseobacterium sp. MEBOG06 TaxID=2879938 RepID=UPI001F25AAE9|nr:hypothetical protein [Chryseobacterium sp. MEBOG06]UKB82399.1 hypothetical protein LF887_15450 [Chryseobacterium sp. MEBOG06]